MGACADHQSHESRNPVFREAAGERSARRCSVDGPRKRRRLEASAEGTRTKLHDARFNPCRYQVGASSMGGGGGDPSPKLTRQATSCACPLYPANDRGRYAVRSRMTALHQARADDESFTTCFAVILMTLAHDRPAVLRDFPVRLNVPNARQLARDSEQCPIKVQRRDDLCGEARAKIHARWRGRADRRGQLDSDCELELRRRQDLWKHY